MAVRKLAPEDMQPESFVLSPETESFADKEIAKYPPGRQASAVIALLTKAQEQAETVLRQLQLTSFFQHIQGWVPGLQLKPAPDAVIVALAALRCAPQQALMVGDTAADILAGKAAGLKTCAVTYGFGTLQELQHCQPDYVIDAFSELVRLVGAP